MQKSLDHEFRCYQIPRATRSARGKGSSKKYHNDNQMCAFDLLATVAGKLLCEKETAPTNCDSSSGRTPEFVKQFNASKNYYLKTNECGPTGLDSSTSVSNEHVKELPDKVKLFKLEVCDQGSSDEGRFAARGGLKQQFCDQGSSDEGPLRIGRSCAGSVVPICMEDIKLVDKNDDGNSSECSQPISITMKMHQSSHIGDRKIRKLWKESPAVLKDGISFKNDGGKTPLFRSERKDHKRQRIQTCLPIKRRRLCGEHSSLMSHGGIGSEGVSCAVGQRTCEGTRATASRTDRDTAVSSPVGVSKLSVNSTDEKVKLTIKSFKVPEFLVEVPETATIGTLKSSVVEAVTSMLGGGMKVSILLEGKKIGDDTQTLRQTCISSSSKLDDVDFMLEPNTAVHSPKPCSSDPFSPLSPEVTQPPNRLNPLSEDSDTTHEGLTVVGSPKPVSCNSEESNCDRDVSPAELPPKEATPSSRALIPTSVATPDALAVVSADRKPRHAELAQRRVRRPFSVAEVEALVKAVEKLGTGRWRDVKLLSFDNAKHRTYVDLKFNGRCRAHPTFGLGNRMDLQMLA